VSWRPAKFGPSATQTFLAPLESNTQATRAAWEAATNCDGKGELKTCCRVKVPAQAGREIIASEARSRWKAPRLAIKQSTFFIGAEAYRDFADLPREFAYRSTIQPIIVLANVAIDKL